MILKFPTHEEPESVRSGPVTRNSLIAAMFLVLSSLAGTIASFLTCGPLHP